MRPVKERVSFAMSVLEVAAEIPALHEMLRNIHDGGSDQHCMNIMPWHSSKL